MTKMCQKSIGNIRDAHQVIGGSVCVCICREDVHCFQLSFQQSLLTFPMQLVSIGEENRKTSRPIRVAEREWGHGYYASEEKNNPRGYKQNVLISPANR